MESLLLASTGGATQTGWRGNLPRRMARMPWNDADEPVYFIAAVPLISSVSGQG
ncbi:hypothetical protein KTQ42_16625|uniref:hypothetical protein n=1 Tax=Noviherbaspirillum sp. L7-7A TaxID=2850560 RepID=UPI001C2CC2D0|nr:hypothetical protein [Noviherbaspirillum sp. L7-7A]MBV0880925.1 hypothetical protein [Noviherbaspirillum sp. L7-7A]